jgi:hypothetical protein
MHNILRSLCVVATAGLTIVACSKEPDIQGNWFFDYEATKLAEFPNAYYETARDLISDVEPRYGQVNVAVDTVVLGGAVCKIVQSGDKGNFTCVEKDETFVLDLEVKNGRLFFKPRSDPTLRFVFNRHQQNPYQIYNIDANVARNDEHIASNEKISVPVVDQGHESLRGLAKTANFNAFFVSTSIKQEGRNSAADMVLNYLEPQNDGTYPQPVFSSVQTVEFDCPASNYRLLRYVMYAGSNSKGDIISDSGPLLATAEWKPVPESSINKLLYMQICK